MNKVIVSLFLGFLSSSMCLATSTDCSDLTILPAGDKKTQKLAECALDHAAASDDIKITVKNNVVTLEGTTMTETSASLAEDTVRSALKNEKGVTVKNNLNGIHD